MTKHKLALKRGRTQSQFTHARPDQATYLAYIEEEAPAAARVAVTAVIAVITDQRFRVFLS